MILLKYLLIKIYLIMKKKQFIFVCLLFSIVSLNSQTQGLQSAALLAACQSYPSNTIYTPMSYFTFDKPSPNAYDDCMPGMPGAVIPAGGSVFQIQQNALVGNCLRIFPGAGSWQAYFPNILYSLNNEYLTNNSRGFTYEFVFRINADYFSSFAVWLKGSNRISISDEDIAGQLLAEDGSNPPFLMTLYSKLIGNGKLSTNYFLDKQWHHIAYTFDGNFGTYRIWIDGEIITPLDYVPPPSYQPLVPREMPAVVNYPSLTIVGLGSGGSIDFDEMAFYTDALPDNMIYQHYLNVMQQNQHYDALYNPAIIAPPPVDPTLANYDPLDFAPNHPFIAGIPQTLDATNSNNNAIPAVSQQLEKFPLPRYKKNHGLNKNINWMDNEYLGRVGGFRNGPHDIRVQTELATNWNYMFNLNPNAAFSSIYQHDLNAFANTHPQFKYSVLTNMNFIKIGEPADALGAYPCNPSLYGYFAPNNINETYFQNLGHAMNSKLAINVLNNTIQPLTAPIDYISENGFESPLFSMNAGGCPYNDPNAIATHNLWPNTFPTYFEYYGYSRARLEKAYRDELITNSAPSFPQLQNTKFSKYLVSSVYEDSYFENYSQHRFLQTPFVHNGNINYYSTPPFYIRATYEWKQPQGGTNWGVRQIIANPFNGGSSGRKYEIAIGDSLFAPFISAGWTDESRNVRPGQWLGLLKILGLVGADYYHTGYFNVTSGNLFTTGTTFPVDPKLWCYQAVMPSYAQGITSRYEKYLHNSSIHEFSYAGSSFFMVRKASGQNKYLVYGTQQQYSNIIGNAPISTQYKIDVPTKPDIDGLKFEIRRQGSTYIYDNSNASAPIFYQLDKWHESTHPSYWTSDFNFEAEVNDNVNNFNYNLVTQRPTGVAPKDFTIYDTYIAFAASDPKADYIFAPRTNNSNYQVWLRLRKNVSSTGSTGVRVYLDGNLLYTMACISNTNWQWYGFDGCTLQKMLLNNVSNTEHVVSVEPIGVGLEFDQLSLKTNLNSSIGVPLACNTCTPTANNKSICYNTKASLTANGSTACKSANTVKWFSDVQLQNQVGTGLSYTTPVLTATTTYYLAFFSGTCHGPSVPVTVTVNPLPIVNAGPDIYTCSDGTLINLTPSPVGGTWTANPYLTGNVFNKALVPSTVIVSNLTYNYTDPVTTCTNADLMSIYIVNNANFSSSIIGPASICSNSSGTYNLTTTNATLQNIMANANLQWQLVNVGTQPVTMVGNSVTNPAVLSTGILANGSIANLRVNYSCNNVIYTVGSKNITKKTTGCSFPRLSNTNSNDLSSAKIDASVIVMPNPNDGQFGVKFNNPNFDKCSLVLKNVFDQIIIRKDDIDTSIKHEFKIDVASGIYFLSVIVDDKIVNTVKVIKE
jgi:Ig-like domain CHU_C associated